MCNTEPGKHLPDERDIRILGAEEPTPVDTDGPFGRIAFLDLPCEFTKTYADVGRCEDRRLRRGLTGKVEEPIALEEGNEISVFDPESFNNHESLGEYLERKRIDFRTFDDEKLSECIMRRMKTPREV